MYRPTDDLPDDRLLMIPRGKRIGMILKLTCKKRRTRYSCFLNPIYLPFTVSRLMEKPLTLRTDIKRGELSRGI